MKKLIVAALSILAPVAATRAQQTPNLNLWLPPYGQLNWQTPINANTTYIDLLLSGNAPLPGLNVTGPAILPELQTWQTGTTYSTGAVVAYQGIFYSSLSSGNVGHIPTNATYWSSSFAGATGSLLATNNLSDLASASTARTNLGLGTAATQASSAFDAAGAATAAQAAAQAASIPRTLFPVGTGGVTANMIVSFDSSGDANNSTGTGFGGVAASTVASGGTVEVIRSGLAALIFDGPAVIGDVAIPSTTAPGEAHDSGFTSTQFIPSTANVIGPIESAAASAGATGTVRLHGPGSFGAQVATSFLLNNTYFVDGFVTALYPGINTVPTTWTSPVVYPLCSTVTYGSANYLAVGPPGAAVGVTPGTNSAIWYRLPGGALSWANTQEVCAFYTALAAAGTGNGTSNVVLYHGGNGITGSTYDISIPLAMPSTGPQVEILGSSQGDNGTPVQIRAIHTMGTMILKPSLTSPASTPYSVHLANVDLNGNNYSTEAFWFSGAKLGLIEHVHMNGFTGTSDWWRLGDSSQPSGEGYNYQWVVNDVQINSSGGTNASITPVVSGGALTGITVNTAGTYNYYTNQGVVPTVHIFGTGASGTSNQPCTTMGTATAVMSGSGLASVTLGGTWSGCGAVGTGLFAYIPDSPAAQYGAYIDDVTDSSFTDIVDNGVGTTACIETVHSSNSFLHAHPYGCPIGIISINGDMFSNTELDSNYIYGAQTALHDIWSGTSFIFNSSTSEAGSKGFYTGSNIYFASSGNVCQSTAQTGGGWALVTTATGDIAHGASAVYPAGFKTTNGQQCDDFSAVTAIPAFTLANGTLATTQAASDSSTKVATTAFVAKSALVPFVPSWLQYLGTGADGANTNASGNLTGEKFYTNFTVPFGNIVTVNSGTELVIHATGTCTIAGTITATGLSAFGISNIGGGSGGGSGGGTAAGTTGNSSYLTIAAAGTTAAGGGSGGAVTGGNGNNGSSPPTVVQRALLNSGAGIDGAYFGGGEGKAGGTSGGALGFGGGSVVLICAAITGTDGTNTGVIDVSGEYGTPATANLSGNGSGGGGGVVILSSQATIPASPNIYFAGGPGALATVPQALGYGGSCTTPPTATLGVTSGALNGTCTVVAAGAGCGTGADVTFAVLGGGGTLGTGTVNPTWSGGTLASCTTTAGTSSGYTASTWTTSGTGGNGGQGWDAIFQNW